MFYLVLHPVIGDDPRFWIIVVLFVAAVAVGLYLAVKLIRALFSRGKDR